MMISKTVYEMPVKEFMNRDLVTIDASGTVHEALTLMEENRVSTLPVIDNGHVCVGILSTSDLVDMARDVDDDLWDLDQLDVAGQRFLVDKLIHSMGHESVQSFMSEKVATVPQDSSTLSAIRKMLKERVHHLPVTGPSDQLVGIISTMDVLGQISDSID